MKQKIKELLNFIYGAPLGERIYLKLLEIIDQGTGEKRDAGPALSPFTAADVLLITYGDMLAPPEGRGPRASGLPAGAVPCPVEGRGLYLPPPASVSSLFVGRRFFGDRLPGSGSPVWFLGGYTRTPPAW